MEVVLPRFYIPDLSSEAQVALPEQEAIHALKVLRLSDGDHIEVVDGKGSLYTGILRKSGKKSCHLELLSRAYFDRTEKANITLVVGLLKSIDRFHWLLEKCTELGVRKVIPLISSNAERRNFNREKAMHSLIAGIKQSRQLWMPELQEASTVNTLLAKPPQELILLAHCRSSSLPPLHKVWYRTQEFTVLIGPEGDFTQQEVALFVKNKAIEISLGEQRLRTETAALKAIIALQTLNELE